MAGELEFIAQIAGAGGGSGLLVYLLATKLPMFNGKAKEKPPHSIPCAPLQVAQSEVDALKDNNVRQWSKMDSMSDTLSEIKGTTQTILSRLPKR